MNLRLFRIIFILFAGLGLSQSALAKSAHPTGPAKQYVQTLSNQIMVDWTDKSLSVPQQKQKMRQFLIQNIDLDLIGKFLVAQVWRSASPTLQQKYLSAFKEHTILTYISQFRSYAGEKFKITSARPVGRSDVLVNTTIFLHDGRTVKIGWRISKRPAGFKVVDVIIEGVSMIKARRSEYASVINKSGLSGLTNILEQRVQKLKAKG